MSGSSALRTVVGTAAIAAPVLHSVTDAVEWHQGGFSAAQRWMNHLAFLPMPWLLLGIYALCAEELDPTALVGALLYGAAFTCFAHTTLYALKSGVTDYESLWRQLGPAYTFLGAVMVIGGVLVAVSACRGFALPRPAVALFGSGVQPNFLLAIAAAPDMLQTLGTAVRNAGLIGMGYSLLFGRAGRAT
jgi:hypothetical protein